MHNLEDEEKPCQFRKQVLQTATETVLFSVLILQFFCLLCPKFGPFCPNVEKIASCSIKWTTRLKFTKTTTQNEWPFWSCIEKREKERRSNIEDVSNPDMVLMLQKTLYASNLMVCTHIWGW